MPSRTSDTSNGYYWRVSVRLITGRAWAAARRYGYQSV